MITCPYCRTANSDDEHRCRRCGRRMSGPLSDTLSEANQIGVQGALATFPAPRPQNAPPAAAPSAPAAPSQPALFSYREPGKVVPIRSAAAAPHSKPASPRAQARRPAGRDPEAQQSLDFLPPAPQAPRKLKTTVEAVIYCDAPVAATMHRAVAAAIDASMVLIAYGLFLLIFHLRGGEFVPDPVSLGVFGAAFALIATFYHLAWILGRSESLGRRLTHLRLITFEGFPPDGSQRLLRFAGNCLSVAPFGIGVLWAVVDEESLTWHDHISKTFLTAGDPASNFVRQR